MNRPLGELILYRTDDGRTEVHLRAAEGTVWMTQGEMAELFDTTKQNISLHVRNVLQDGELRAEGTVKDYLTVQTEGKRTVNRSVQLYRLEMILAVGFRVRSPRGSQFRRWAGDALSEYLVKGFLLDDERLKDAERADYFKELLHRIRDIRSSEKRFYQTLRELFKVSSSDYDGSAATARTFFATIQNKLVYAVTGRTAAQLIVERADSNALHMGLTNWTGDKPRKSDAVVSKNYLLQQELEQLNRLVSMFLDFAEDRAERRIETRMLDWIRQTDRFLDFNERAILDGAGRVSNEQMEAIITERYAEFDATRRASAMIASEREAELDLANLSAEAKRLASSRKPT
ncbi:virulence RhuM family protein [Stenotrophomonas cyclobalanopsidis]|uniref:Virulence RhuM family protein n=1 Tax=Stenotrophomonas cyclobalanopsidis TaxID=2771362 RepID=A0ABQ6T5L3_9GAMM|nr:virulence RhuM family protein [Stenotrophomonas cyclobalanopsidis]KAA9004300.1 virulence RhuM family protein [Stenotrophomonas cyclobalanopsidis]